MKITDTESRNLHLHQLAHESYLNVRAAVALFKDAGSNIDEENALELLDTALVALMDLEKELGPVFESDRPIASSSAVEVRQ